ncbi:unnamed protein product [Microthlaspi erraticum]|uniref:Uncharacterized protein n=1 Tax=Microthlaspi erraticum TaxID=1685480 RepID=A0A6D2IRM3_9BRAS|nr:unnamed protein product [Microthlaspi erraticum]
MEQEKDSKANHRETLQDLNHLDFKGPQEEGFIRVIKLHISRFKTPAQSSLRLHLCSSLGTLAVLFNRNWLCAIQVEDEEGISSSEYDPHGHHEVVHFTNILLQHEDMSDE